MVSSETSVSWLPDFYDFGSIYWKDDPSTEFQYVGSKTISSIETNCPCVSVKLRLIDGKYKLYAQWKPKQPSNTFYSSIKRIIIKYTDHTRDVLTLQASITANKL